MLTADIENLQDSSFQCGKVNSELFLQGIQ